VGRVAWASGPVVLSCLPMSDKADNSDEAMILELVEEGDLVVGLDTVVG
jgi:hypothetical protein